MCAPGDPRGLSGANTNDNNDNDDNNSNNSNNRNNSNNSNNSKSSEADVLSWGSPPHKRRFGLEPERQNPRSREGGLTCPPQRINGYSSKGGAVGGGCSGWG